jgi:predicted CoA-binding protein
VTDVATILTDLDLKRILTESKTIALVGASRKPERDSNSIMRFLLGVGYRVVPVNPVYADVLGQRCYPSLHEIPEPIDLVDVFRRSEFLLPIAHDAIGISARTLWIQLGIANDAAEGLAIDAGLNVVSNRCILIEHRRLM